MNEKNLKQIIEAIVYNLQENVGFQENRLKENENMSNYGRYENAIEIQKTINDILKIYDYKY